LKQQTIDSFRKANMNTTVSDQRPALFGALASHPFLEGVDDRLLTLLISGAQSFQFRRGEYLGQFGDPTNDFFLIQWGHVSVLAAGAAHREIYRVKPGEVVGWSWVVPPYRWQFTCQAVDEVSGIRFNADWLRRRCEEHHELGYVIVRHLLTVVANRLAATRFDLESPTVEVTR
jgi:CRP/FNR family transcriptional regulator, cyclic AMP receptor protein